MLRDSTILVTGGTGSFGNMFVPMTLEKYDPAKIIIYSRDEMKQWEMAKKFEGDPRVRFFIGDVRDKDRLYRALDGVDYVVHAAATKIVPTAEYNPFECVKTNINGAMNLIDACIDKGVKRTVALSTDKASSPVNLYGATKLASDKLFVAGNSYAGSHETRFSVVRYGNVMGSRGSVIPFFMSIRDKGVLPITDERMTRFMISLEHAVELVWHAFDDMEGGEIYVKKIPSMKVTDLASTIAPQAELEFIGIRPGEKLHEQMISEEDSLYTYEYTSHFKILPTPDVFLALLALELFKYISYFRTPGRLPWSGSGTSKLVPTGALIPMIVSSPYIFNPVTPEYRIKIRLLPTSLRVGEPCGRSFSEGRSAVNWAACSLSSSKKRSSCCSSPFKASTCAFNCLVCASIAPLPVCPSGMPFIPMAMALTVVSRERSTSGFAFQET